MTNQSDYYIGMSNVDFVLYTLPRITERLRLRFWEALPSDVQVTEHQLRLLRQMDDVDPVMVGELAEYLGAVSYTHLTLPTILRV